jgi:signal transduction histidine kinase
VTLIGLWFGARQVIGPIRKLMGQAEELALANYEAIEESVGGIGEIQSLQKTLAWMAQNIRASQAALQRYIGAITDAQEEERKRLARELHDESIQDLIAIDQHIQMIHMDLKESTELAGRLGEVRQEVNVAIEELRRVIRALRPIYLDDLGLVPALQMLAKDTEGDHDILVNFALEGDAVRLLPSVELAVYRIAQEALSNAVRHARANRITLGIIFKDDAFSLGIRDDGVGFSPPERPKDLGALGHFGLMGMFERAELIGATLDLSSDNESGTQVCIKLQLLNNT